MSNRHDKTAEQIEAMRRAEAWRIRKGQVVQVGGPAGPKPEESPMPDEATTQFVSEDVIREAYEQAHAAELAEQQRFLDWLGSGADDYSMFE